GPVPLEPDEDPGPDPERPPDVEPVVRATHVEAPPLEYEEDDDEPVLIEPDEEEVKDEEIEPIEYDEAELTPQGRFRSSVTEADDFEYSPPSQSVLTRSRGKETVDTRGQQRTASQLVEALGHFGVEAQVVGTVAG